MSLNSMVAWWPCQALRLDSNGERERREGKDSSCVDCSSLLSGCGILQRTEQNKIGQNRADQDRTDQNRTEQ